MGLHKLYYDKPADLWHDGLPIGNGRLGAMVRGTTNTERLWVNEDSVWYGGPQNRVNPAARDALPKIRELIDAGEITKAEELILQSMTALPQAMRHYEPLGDVLITFGHGEDPPGHHKISTGLPAFERQAHFRDDRESVPTNYRRELDLKTGLATVEYDFGGGHYKREVFTSTADEVICMRITSDRELTFSVTLNRGDDPDYDKSIAKKFDSLIPIKNGHLLSGATGGRKGIEFAMGYRVIVEGEGEVIAAGIDSRVRARSTIILVAGETNFRNADADAAVQARLEAASSKSWAQLFEAHAPKFSALYDRVELDAGGTEHDAEPVNARLERVRNGGEDTGLPALLFHFGRYLLISSSLTGLPANLQGLWNADFTPTWGSKYTININIQMNYWPAETTALPECTEALLAHVRRMSERGAATARDMYGCRGWVAHHNTDAWADTAPSDRVVQATFWTLGGAWLCLHLWERYLFSRDEGFLRGAFPIMRGAALFFQDFLVERGGRLVTSPSTSAENSYYIPGSSAAGGRRIGFVCAGPAWDAQILRELFSACAEAAAILGLPAAEYEAVLEKLPLPRIGRHGQIVEWDEDYEEVEVGHRHFSHLWGLFPGTSIASEELKDAARVTLRRRLSGGSGHTSWSLAWILCLYARLREASLAQGMVEKLLRASTLDSLLTTHPPFQIDGNLGFTGAVAEMLVQSHEGWIELLPCLLPYWEAGGSVRGLRARGNVEVDISWRGAKLVEARLVSKVEQSREVRIRADRLSGGNGQTTVELVADTPVVLTGDWAGDRKA